MRSTILLLAGAAAITITGCSSGITVRTTAEPGASLAGLHTFEVLTPPTRAANASPLSTNDPMLENSITNRHLRDDLRQAFQSRGYAVAPQSSADFLVAYYAGTKEKLDTTYWAPTMAPAWRYRYWGRRSWAWPYYGAPYYSGMNPWGSASVSSYTQGQVIVDVTDPHTNQLLWRGQGVEPVSSDPNQYATDMQKVVNAIVAKFPQASAAAVASSP
jgi:hypothetical protein